MCSKLLLKVLMPEKKKEWVFIVETFLTDCEADPMPLGYYGWWVFGFQLWSIHKMSINAVEEERRITAQKSSRGSVLAEIDVNFIFWHPRRGDGGIDVVSEKCRHCFLYRNVLEIENLYRKEEDGVGWRTCSWFTTKTPPAMEPIKHNSSWRRTIFGLCLILHIPQI